MEERIVSSYAVDAVSPASVLHNELVTPENTLFFRKILEKALENPAGLDRRLLARAWALLADLRVSDYLNRWNEARNGLEAAKVLLEGARDAVQKALDLDGSVALAHYANGLIHRAEGDHPGALKEFEQALNYDPDFARAYAQNASEWINLGQPDKAPSLVKKAIKLSPRDPSLGMFHWNLGRAYFFEGRYREAIPSLREALKLRPNLWHNWLYLASAYALIKNKRRAKEVLRDFRTYPLFSDLKFTLTLVKEYERANPNTTRAVVRGRDKFHRGLIEAGIEK